MPKSIFHSKLICNNTWLVEGEGCNCYLVVGDERGVVIDTGFSPENIQLFAQSLTNKPVKMAANTHGHFDHTGGNGWFAGTYMSTKALEIAKNPYPSKATLRFPLDYLVTIIGEGDSIELGKRKLEVIEIPAHAPSSVAFLDRKERILYSGDEVANFVMLYWMNEKRNPTVEQHAQNMEKLMKFRNSFDYICAGHDLVMGDASIVNEYLEHDQMILNGLYKGEQLEIGSEYPVDFQIIELEFMRVSTHKRTKLGFDIRFIHNQEPIHQ